MDNMHEDAVWKKLITLEGELRELIERMEKICDHGYSMSVARRDECLYWKLQVDAILNKGGGVD